MAHNLLLATRKGVFEVAWPFENKASSHKVVLQHHFEGDSASQILVDSRDANWYVAQNLGHFGVKVKRSTDRGQSWVDVSAPAFGVKPQTGRWSEDPTQWKVSLIWCLAQGGADQPGELWAGCLPAGLFRSVDYGASWTLIDSLWLTEQRTEWMGGGFDEAGIHSIIVDPRDPSHLTLGISCGGVWTTKDRGQTWRLIGQGQEADYLPPEHTLTLNQQDPHRLVGCRNNPDVLWIQHHGGQYISHDGGENFQRFNKGSSCDFGFAVAVDPNNAARAWFVPAVADMKRYAINGALQVLRTNDAGKSVESFRAGLPQENCFDLIYRHGLIVDSTGSRLAMASTTGHVWCSQDAGESWIEVQGRFPLVNSLTWS